MSSLHIFLPLALGLSINTSIASESLKGSSTVFLQDKQPIVIAKKKDRRQRSPSCETGMSPKNPPNVWALDICQSRNCYAAPNQVSLWWEKRPPNRTVQVKVKNLNNSDSVRLSWSKKNTTWDWPEESMPIYSGTSYQIRIWNRSFEFQGKISLYQIPTEHETVAAKAKWMRENGCESQAEMLQP